MTDTSQSGAMAAPNLPPVHPRATIVPPLVHTDPPAVETSHRPRRAYHSILALLGGAVFGGLFAAAGMRILGSDALANPAIRYGGRGALAAWIALLLVMMLIVITIHEGGHALGGRLAGLRLIAFVVGPLQIVRADGRLHMAFNRRLAHAGGLVLCVPTRWTGARAFRRAFRWCLAGGPLASLVAGAAAVTAARSVTTAPAWTSALFTAGLMSLVIGVGTLIPLRMPGGFVSDGGQLLQFRESRARPGSTLSRLTPLTALTLLAQTVRLCEWDAELVREVAAAAEHDEHAVIALSFLYYRALDSGDVAGARDALQGALDRAAMLTTPAGDRSRRMIAVEAAIFEGVWRQDAAATRAWLETAAGGAALDAHGAQVATAAIAAREGSSAAAQSALAQAAQIARRSLFPGVALSRRPTLERLAAPIP